jgi:hypothetical protein
MTNCVMKCKIFVFLCITHALSFYKPGMRNLILMVLLCLTL